MFSNKKAIIAVQFNWILVLIVGGLIMLLFISIVQKQSQISNEEIAGTIQTDLQAILSSSQVSTETASIVEMPNKEITFNCEGGMPGFKLGAQTPARFPYAFAPDLIKSDRSAISVYAYDWSVPYKVTNFLYVTSPDIRYIIIYDSASQNLAQELQNIMPPPYIVKDQIQKLFMKRDSVNSIDDPSIHDTNNYKVRLIEIEEQNIYFNEAKNKFSSTKAKDLSGLKINFDCGGAVSPQDKLDCGTITFTNYNNGVWDTQTSKFVGKAALLAAIFSENKEIYECGMNNSFKRLESVSDIYKSKSIQLKTDYPACSDKYQIAANTNIANIASAARAGNYGNIYAEVPSLDLLNNALLEASCPSIY